MKPQILSMGTMYVDINAKKFPYKDGLKLNTETVGGEYEVAPGGSALNFARFCAALELQPAFVGKIGSDEMGSILSQLVKKSGVFPAFIQSQTVTTNIGINFLGEDGSSIMTVVGTANQSLSGEEVIKKIAQIGSEVEYLYLGGCFKLKALLPFYSEIVKTAAAHGAKVVLDHGRVTNAVGDEDKAVVRALMPHIAYYMPSKDEFLALWDVKTIEDGVKKVAAVSAAQIVVKDAEKGAVGWDGKNIVKVPAFSVDVRNSVGAGDCFNAGFIKAQNTQLSFEESIKFGCAAAALKISEEGLPTVEKVKKMLG